MRGFPKSGSPRIVSDLLASDTKRHYFRAKQMPHKRSGPTRMVVDSNALQSPLLRDYLSRSIDNFAVLTDYASMEAYKGNTLVSIFRSMALLADFSRQVIVLKTTGVVCGLRGRRPGLQRRLIDHEQTRGFPKYCDRLLAAKLGDVYLREQLLHLGREADAQMARMLADATNIPEAIEGIVNIFTDSELKIIRTGLPFPEQLVRKILENIAGLAKSLYSQHPHPTVVRSVDELPNTFLFRSALCSFLWALDWISTGGPKGVKTEKMRNDLVDVTFATFATYFDGLLSMDEKPRRIYRQAAFVLESITNGPGDNTARASTRDISP